MIVVRTSERTAVGLGCGGALLLGLAAPFLFAVGLAALVALACAYLVYAVYWWVPRQLVAVREWWALAVYLAVFAVTPATLWLT